jgi:hypothetical protein
MWDCIHTAAVKHRLCHSEILPFCRPASRFTGRTYRAPVQKLPVADESSRHTLHKSNPASFLLGFAVDIDSSRNDSVFVLLIEGMSRWGL